MTNVEYDRTYIVARRGAGKSTMAMKWAIAESLDEGAHVLYVAGNGHGFYEADKVLADPRFSIFTRKRNKLFLPGLDKPVIRRINDHYKFNEVRGHQFSAVVFDDVDSASNPNLYYSILLALRLKNARLMWVGGELTLEMIKSLRMARAGGFSMFVSINTEISND